MATNTDAVEKALRGGLRAVGRGLNDIGDAVLDQFRVVVSDGYPPPSAPGSPPHARTGAYVAGLAVKTSGNTITIYARGSENNKAVWLEFGTRKMAARPHWRTHLPVIAARTVPVGVGAVLVRGEIT